MIKDAQIVGCNYETSMLVGLPILVACKLIAHVSRRWRLPNLCATCSANFSCMEHELAVWVYFQL